MPTSPTCFRFLTYGFLPFREVKRALPDCGKNSPLAAPVRTANPALKIQRREK
jgi:hypothetical protein